MTTDIDNQLLKKIKRHLYGHPQYIDATFPAGMGDIALTETESILNSLWFPQKYQSQLSLLKNIIRIHPIHLFAATELLMRSQCLTDVRLVIFEGKTYGKFVFEKKCEEIDWDMYLNKNMLVKIKVDSIASKAFHETGLKQILTTILNNHTQIVTDENTTPTTTVYATLHQNRLTVSISLAGDALYKRGYRGTLSSSAPLREDMAACCIQKALLFAKKDFIPETLLIPFSGTGTFAFEYLMSYLHFIPALFERDYALQKLPFFRNEHFQFLLKKAKEQLVNPEQLPSIYCIDNSVNANTALEDNWQALIDYFNKNAYSLDKSMIHLEKHDFFDFDVNKNLGNVFILMNPPYGIRLGKSLDTNQLYKHIAVKINEFVSEKQQSVLGFILCPTQESWSAFCNELRCDNTETYHFTQGGIDIRVCQFFIGRESSP